MLLYRLTDAILSSGGPICLDQYDIRDRRMVSIWLPHTVARATLEGYHLVRNG